MTSRTRLVAALALSAWLAGCNVLPHGPAEPRLAGKRSRTNHKTYKKGYGFDEYGWRYVHIEGEPFERGEQYGFLTADLYAEFLDSLKAMTYEETGCSYDFFVKQAVRMHKDKIPHELLEEMRGYASGLEKAGVKATLDDIIGANAYKELTQSWWPVMGKKEFGATAGAPYRSGPCCSAFIATGSATKDGKIVIGHGRFASYWTSIGSQLMVDVKPAEGYRILMQAGPGYVSSMSDYFITNAGIVGAATTIAGFNKYDPKGVPEYVRIRMAMQYGDSIAKFIELLNKGNNGGYANVWLVGDLKTNEIAQFQQGLVYTSVQKKKDGAFFGCNVAFDPRIRNLECVDTGYNDVRRQTGGRRVRWPQLLKQRHGRIDAKVGMVMLADTYDVYRREVRPGANTICAHNELDPRPNFSDPNGVWPCPYTPAGSLDGKVTTADMAKQMQTWAIFGSADGRAFDADAFLDEHPQWDCQRGYLLSRPSQPWVVFRSGER